MPPAQGRAALDGPTLSMIFDISMGLRREDVTLDVTLKVEVEAALERLRPAITLFSSSTTYHDSTAAVRAIGVR
jgi:hypothetical protein